MKVYEKYQINEFLLQELASKSKKSDYFENSLKFFNSVRDKDTLKISQGQEKWLKKLSEILSDIEQKNISKRISKSKKKKFTIFPKKTKSGWVWFFYHE